MTACRYRRAFNLRWRTQAIADDIGYTRHGETRMRQRGMKKGDVDVICTCGTQVDDKTWFLSNRDVDRAIEDRKRKIKTHERGIEIWRQEVQILGRLRNRKVVMSGNRVVTTYPSQPVDQKRILRRARQKGWWRR